MKFSHGWYHHEAMKGLGTYIRRSKVIEVAMKYLPPERRRTVIQAGGHQGVWPVTLAGLFDHVYSWEPIPSNWECLVKNTEKFDNITITQGCLGDELGEVKLEDKSNKNTGASFINPRGTVTAKLFRLDDYTFPAPIDAMFLDVEGYELRILLGGHVHLHNYRPAVLVIEENGLQKRRFDIAENAVGNYLKQFGYVFAERWEEDVIYVLEDYHYDP